MGQSMIATDAMRKEMLDIEGGRYGSQEVRTLSAFYAPGSKDQRILFLSRVSVCCHF